MVSALVLLLSCASPTPEEAVVVAPVARLDRLTRASLDLRGVRPSLAELEAVEADPAALDAMIDTFVDDPRFPDRLVALYQEIYLTNTENIDLRPSNVPFADPKLFFWKVGQEPLQIVAQIAREDLPYTTVVTADWTMADEDIGSWFPVDYPAGATGWQKVHYTDGRPAAGVIATNGLWWRYVTTEANANRRRANALTRILVCEDFLQRPIEFDQSGEFFDEDAIADAIRDNPACANCHVSLDPVASNLFGFYWTNFTSATEGRIYHPAKEQYWEKLTGVAPGWFGQPLRGLVDLGAAVAADPRFPTCAVEQAFELMMRRESTVDDADDLTALREQFLASGLRLKPLYRAIADLPVYTAAIETDEARALPRKLMTPDLLGASVEALTGFSWQRGGADVLQTDLRGVRSLAGGVEGVMVKKAALAPDATVVLVQEALADQAAAYALAAEQAQAPAERRLFTLVDFTETPETGEAAMRAQVQRLHALVLSHPVALDGVEVDAALDLWGQLYAIEGSPPLAWQGVLNALLRDPDFLLY